MTHLTNDTTEPVLTEREVRQSEKELRDFVENIAVPLHWVGDGGTILWANAAELRLLGYSRDEYVGHNIAEFHVDRLAIEDILCRLTRNEELQNYQSRLRCKDGSTRPVEISSSVYREEGRFVHTRCVTLDITDRMKISELQARLAAIVESSADAILSKDLDGIIRSWNSGAERLFGYKAEEVIGKHISVLAVADRIDEFPDILGRIRKGQRVEHYETKRKAKDGRVIAVSLSVSPIRDATGTIIGASKIARDMSEREMQREALQEANEALMQSNADLQQFVYSASHDLQEPLRMVSIYTEMLRKKFSGMLGPAGDEYIAYAMQGALRMGQLLNDLRTYMQASIAGDKPQPDLDSQQVLDKSLANLEASIRESGAVVTHTELPKVPLHEFQLEQLFQNLIGNAIRYRGPDAPRIHVAAVRRPGEWLFSVKDNGIGIAPQYQEQIFGIFKRLHSAAEYPGTGMGLAICHRIVEQTGGRIWVESEQGRGSTFYFTVPDREG